MPIRRRELLAGAALLASVGGTRAGFDPTIDEEAGFFPCTQDGVSIEDFLARVEARQFPPGCPVEEPYLLPTLSRINRMAFEARPGTLLDAHTMDTPRKVIRGGAVTARTRMFATQWEIEAWRGLESRPFASWAPSDAEIEPVANALADEIAGFCDRLPRGHALVAYVPITTSGANFTGRGMDTCWSMSFLTRYGVTPDLDGTRI